MEVWDGVGVQKVVEVGNGGVDIEGVWDDEGVWGGGG